MAEASTSRRSDTQASPSISFATYMQMVLGMESKMAVAKKGTARKNRTAGGKSSSSQIDLVSMNQRKRSRCLAVRPCKSVSWGLTCIRRTRVWAWAFEGIPSHEHHSDGHKE
jgi:hypothetical protein